MEFLRTLSAPVGVVQLDPAIQVMEDERVYPPSEDTRLLLEAIDLQDASSFLEVGTGTGFVALHAAVECEVIATDINPHAVALSRLNATSNHLSLEIVRTDVVDGLRGPFDVIAFNPPYLPDAKAEAWIDRAWSGGPDGNAVILQFLNQVSPILAVEGTVYLLLSSHNSKALQRARQLFHARPLARKPLFFEDIVAYELRRVDSPRNYH